jgi:hypothetical protein
MIQATQTTRLLENVNMEANTIQSEKMVGHVTIVLLN